MVTAFMGEMGGSQFAATLDEFATLCVPVALDDRWRPRARDRNDDPVLETAINGGADVVASFNVADMQPGAVVRRMKE